MPFAVTLTCAAALLLDRLLGEPRRHPLVGFGHLATALEGRLYGDNRWRGAIAMVLLVAPFTLLVWWLARLPGLGVLVDVLVLTLALGLRSLREHAEAVASPLLAGDLTSARAAVARLVSRDTEPLNENGMAAATSESVLENGSDAVIGALVWFAIGGAAAVVAFRLVNTLDAMWGYRTARYRRFGWAAARTDDILGLIPARLTALLYAMAGNTRRALHCWALQARHWSSPNAGPVMASGAGALGVRLGGPSHYHGESVDRPVLGDGAPADATTPRRALVLLRRAVLFTLLLFALMEWGQAGWPLPFAGVVK